MKYEEGVTRVPVLKSNGPTLSLLLGSVLPDFSAISPAVTLESLRNEKEKRKCRR